MKTVILCAVMIAALGSSGCKPDTTPANFVAVGNEGGICWSADGQTWSCKKVAEKWLSAVTFGNGEFMAVTSNGEAYTSADGKNWTGGVIDGTKNFNDIAYGDHVFIAVDGFGSIARYDTAAETPAWEFEMVSPAGGFMKVAFGSGRFAATSMSGVWYTDSPLVKDSWKLVDIPMGGSPFKGLVYDNGSFMFGQILNGWVYFAPPAFTGLSGFRCNGDRIIPMDFPVLTHGTYDGGDVLVIAGEHKIARSLDAGETWSDVTPANFTDFISCAAYGNGQFILTGLSGAIYRSADGGQTWSNWSCTSKKFTEAKAGVAFRNEE